MSLVEPYEENIKKMWKIEKKRIEKGEHWGKDTLFPIHNVMTTGTSFMIVETDDTMKLAKYRQDYYGVLDIEIHMIKAFDEIRDLYK
jgi:hypothetical protein